MLKIEQQDLTRLVNDANDENQPDAGGAGDPAQTESVMQRLAEISAELSAIQKALVAIAGLGAVSALTDDGYNDNVPPVITINGDNCNRRAWYNLY